MKTKTKIITVVIIFIMVSSGIVFFGLTNNSDNSKVFTDVIPYTTSQPIKTVSIKIIDTPAKSITYQQEIIIAGGYSSYINKNFSNVAFTFSNGTSIYSWYEGYNNSYIVWLKLYDFINQTIDMNIYSSSTFLFSKNGYEGENPNLSSVYAEYDNGKKVFNFYTDFAGTTLNTTLWNTNSNLGYVDNGFYPVLQTSGTTEPYTTLYHTLDNYTDFGLVAYTNTTNSGNRQLNRNSGDSSFIVIGCPNVLQLSVDNTASSKYTVNTDTTPNVFSLLVNTDSTTLFHNYNSVVNVAGTPTDTYLGTEFITNAADVGVRILWEDLRTNVSESPIILTNGLPTFINQTYYINNIPIHNMSITLKNVNLIYSNYTNTGYFGNYTNVIFSRHNRWNTPVLIYVATNKSLMVYFIYSQKYLVLHKWYVSPIMNMTVDSNEAIAFYQNMTTGDIMYVYSSFSYNSTDSTPFIQVYDFNNNSYYFYNESTFSSHFYEAQMINDKGDMLIWASGDIYILNVFNNTFLIHIPENFVNALDLVNQNIIEANNVISGLTYYYFYIYHPLTDTFTYYNFTSAFGVSSATGDFNNAPIFIKTYSNGTTMLSGIMNDRPSFDAIYSEIDFYSNDTAKIVYQTVISSSSKGGFDSNSDGAETFLSNSMMMPAQLNIWLSDSSYANYSFPFMNLGNITLFYNSTVQKYVNNVYYDSVLYAYKYNLIDDAGLNDYVSGATYSSNSLILYWLGNTSLNLSSPSSTKYTLTLIENGLPVGFTWSFIFNSTKYSLTNNTYNFILLNNTYFLNVFNINHYIVSYNSVITISGKNEISYVNFTAILYKVNFKIFGLPQNFSWAVYINGEEYISNSSSNSMIINLTAGIYNPIVVIPNGYNLNDIGTLIVNGNTSYYIQVSQSPFLFLQNNLAYIIVFIFIMMILILAIAVRGRRE